LKIRKVIAVEADQTLSPRANPAISSQPAPNRQEWVTDWYETDTCGN